MRIKTTYLISLLFLLFGCNQKQIDTRNYQITEYREETKFNLTNRKIENRIAVLDTITNWQFYKDSELLFKSNILGSKGYKAEIKVSDNYENLILTMFYDFNNEIMKRKVKLVYENNILATFVDKNRSHSRFQITKSEIDRIMIGNIGKNIYINYTDRICKDGMTIGILKFTNK